MLVLLLDPQGGMQSSHLAVGSLVHLGQEIVVRPGGCEVCVHIFWIYAPVLHFSAIISRLHFWKQAQILFVEHGLSCHHVLRQCAHLRFCSVLVAFKNLQLSIVVRTHHL